MENLEKKKIATDCNEENECNRCDGYIEVSHHPR